MDERNKSKENNKGKKQSEKAFPPKFEGWDLFLFLVASTFVIGGLVYIGDQLCFERLLPPCVCCTYIAFGFVLCGLIIDRWIHHKLIVHKERCEDISEVGALFVEARTVERPSSGPMADEERFKRKKNDLLEEVKRLEDIGNNGWTEYQVLSLNQMLVDFLEKDELKARARSTLADLEDYAEDSAYRYDQKQYEQWRDNIDESIDKIDDAENAGNTEDINESIKALKAELRTLLEHVASYTANWSKGSAILNGIRICSVLAIPLLLGMGLLPIVHPANIGSIDKQLLSFFNWSVLGIIGAIAAVLLNLRKSDYVEVGNTEGRKELWRTIPGIGLGFIAGALAYWMIAGELLKHGGVVPDLGSASLKHIGLSTLWAVSAGFYFERIFDRMLNTTIGGS